MAKGSWRGMAAISLLVAALCALACEPSAMAQPQAGSPETPARPQAATHEKALRPSPPSRLSQPGWAPPGVDEQVPPVASDVPCELPRVLGEASRRVKELVSSLQEFTATEQIEHSELKHGSQWSAPKSRSFEYVVVLSEIRRGILNVEETRNGESSLSSFPTSLAATGLTALALVFHPYYIGDYNITCEGLGELHGQRAWQVRFEQSPSKSPRIRQYRISGRTFPVKLRGRAWFAADSYQILRLETELADAIPAINLRNEHTVIEYRPVQFVSRKVELWLPESADLFMDFRGHRYHHRHAYSDYQLFSVDTNQRIREPN